MKGNMMNKIDFAKDMKIDEGALDVELLNQVDLEAKYIKAVSEARKDRDWASEEVKTMRSELTRDCFDDPEKTIGRDDGKPPTAAQVESYYRTHKNYKSAKEDFIEKEDRYNVLSDMKDAIHFTRTKMLENLVRLFSEEYFAGPRIPRNLQKERKEWDANNKRNKRIGKKLKRSSK
jgi:hypothetical protein